MSLFKARDWWTTTVGSGEVFDQGSLAVAKIDGNSASHDKIVVGSLNGVLRIYQPQPSKGDNLKAEDVVLEAQLQQPILQVETGRFVSASESVHLSVLHPRKLAIYSVHGVTGAVEHGSQYHLKLMYEHNLQRTAHSLVVGPFGGVKGKDFLCVQSMDGTVSFFEQESFAFSRFLPGFLLPGPIKYIPRTDSFVTVSSSWQVESYKYQVLAVASDSKTKEESQKMTLGKRITADWTYPLGEPVLDMSVITHANAVPSIVILGERSVVCLKDVGTLSFSKKLEYNPSSFFIYASLNENSIQYMVGTHTRQLLVYEDATLKWAAKLEHVPVALRIGEFQDLKGIIVSLDDEGHLMCSYLGTDPSLFVVPPPDSREIDYDNQDKEMKDLQRIIKDSSHKADFAPKKKIDDDLTMTASVPSNLDASSAAQETEIPDEDQIPLLTVKLTLKSQTGISNVRVLLHCPYPLAATQSTFTIPYVGDVSNPTTTMITFFMRGHCLPASLVARATATYTTSAGVPHIVQCTIKLPLKLVCKPCQPAKNATHKITLDSNKNCANLHDIFPDLTGPEGMGSGNALGLQIFGGPRVTILASKSSQRYRLQCDIFEAMWPVVNEFIERVRIYHVNTGVKDFKLSFSSNLMMQEYFELIDTHMELRVHAERYKELLDQRAKQFRAIQRRLLTRFKDKTPSPLNNLDTLLEGTYRQILKLAEGVDENQKALVRCSMGLSCATSIITTLLALAHGFSESEKEILDASLSSQVQCEGDQGWEETVDASIINLLKTCLAKSAKDQAINPAPLTLTPDTTKLKKHIMQVTEKLAKGSRLHVEGQAQGERDSSVGHSHSNSTSESNDFFDEEPASTNNRSSIESKPAPMASQPQAPPYDAAAPPDRTSLTDGTPSSNGLGGPALASPRSQGLLGDLPAMGGIGVRGGSSLPSLGGAPAGGSSFPALQPIKKKKKKKKKSSKPRDDDDLSDDTDLSSMGRSSPDSIVL
ncbi:protein PTHB1-like isoform X1 [Lytechinus pictus]|uniref:protein PTHB1-like isoform X1 n=1 Tax=Lytechinus pictus TaxID=7653 RepID=UPI0030B9BAA8